MNKHILYIMYNITCYIHIVYQAIIMYMSCISSLGEKCRGKAILILILVIFSRFPNNPHFWCIFFGNSQSARPPGYWRPAVPSPPMLRTASRQGGHGAGAADAASGRGPNVPQLPFPTHFWLSLRRGAQQSQKQINAISLMSAFIWKNSPPLQAVCYFDPIFHFLFEGKWGLTLQLDDALLAGAKKSAVNPKGRLVCAVIITQNCSLRHMIWGRTAFCGIFAHVLLYWHFTSSIFARS